MPLISHSKAPRKRRNGVTSTVVAKRSKNSSLGFLKQSLQKGQDWVEITLPLLTVSEANGGQKKAYKKNGKTCYKGEHWSEAGRRHELQKGTVLMTLRPHRKYMPMPCNIFLTRYAPDTLDRFDNLPMSFKWILDAVCQVITGDNRPGRADAHEGILDVKYSQVKSNEYGVKIHVQSVLGGVGSDIQCDIPSASKAIH